MKYLLILILLSACNNSWLKRGDGSNFVYQVDSLPRVVAGKQAQRFNILDAGISEIVWESDPASHATIFLDFDGQTVSGTEWNWSGIIYAKPSGLSVESSFYITRKVAKYFAPFRLNITTDSTVYFKAPKNQRIRMIVTTTNDWYKGIAGVTAIGSFTRGDETPGWVFTTTQKNEKYVADALAHEIGHALGLSHQSLFDSTGKLITHYRPGAIMGWPYETENPFWTTGTTFNINSKQDDIALIAGTRNGFGFRLTDTLLRLDTVILTPHGYDTVKAYLVMDNQPYSAGTTNIVRRELWVSRDTAIFYLWGDRKTRITDRGVYKHILK